MYATMVNFVLAMMEHPEVQRKAHDEIDSVVRNSVRSIVNRSLNIQLTDRPGSHADIHRSSTSTLSGGPIIILPKMFLSKLIYILERRCVKRFYVGK